MRRAIAILILELGFLLNPLAALAQAQSAIPEFNPLCWKEDQCLAIRQQIMTGAAPGQIKEGWVKGDPPCAREGWGKCLPAGITFTQISFAGRRKFLHIGDFIQTMYKYAISIAAIVAVGVIIWAGFTWVTSGGSADRIGEAKKRLGGAMMGLLIAYLSYLILQTLNPALVNLRLPQIWLVRPQNLVPEFCSVVSSTGKFALAVDDSSKEGQQKAVEPPQDGLNYDLRFGGRPANDLTFYCGKRFYIESGGASACWGDECGADKRCLPDFSSPQTFSWCQEGDIAVLVTHRSFAKDFFPDLVTEEWINPPVTAARLEGVCIVRNIREPLNLPTMPELVSPKAPLSTLSDGKTQWFIIKKARRYIKSALQECERNKGEFKGFALQLDFNESYDPTDETHFIGRNGVDLGDRGVFRKGFFDKHAKDLPAELFISREEIENGMTMTIEAASVKDIDSEKDRSVYYSRFGISP